MTEKDVETALREPLTTAAVVAKLLQISPRTANRLLDDGKLEGFKIGAIRRFRTAPLRKLHGSPGSNLETCTPVARSCEAA